jgi:iron(III) transport system ATP-binding protein
VNGFSAGQAVRVGIRPEEVRLGGTGLVAQVEAAIFMGAFTRVSLTIAGLDRAVEADIAGTAPAAGEFVRVDMPVDAVRVFPA